MKIAIVHPTMNTRGGGERVVIHSIIAGLKGGHDVSLVSEAFDTESFEDFFGCKGVLRRVDHLTYPAFKPVAKKGLLYQRIRYHRRRIKAIISKTEPFGLVLSSQDIGYVPTVSSPIVQYCYFPEYFSHLESDRPSPWWKMYYGSASRYYRDRVRQLDLLLSVSDFTRGFVKAKWGRGSITLYPPCPVGLYLSSNQRKENLVVTVGRVVPGKRMHLVFDMAAALPDCKFAIIGSVSEDRAGYFEGLRSQAPRNVSFVLSPLRKVRGLLGRAKAYVHCALNEHFGISIVEAMAAGCVPLVHDSGGPREIVVEGVGYRWRDTSEAVGQISRLMRDDELSRKLSFEASNRARIYRPEVFESRLLDILKGL